MKKFNFIYGALVAGAMLFTSCDLNDYPKFDDADAFIAFESTDLSVDETGDSINVPVLLTSLAGLEGTATIEVDSASTAVEGVHYQILGSKTLNFTKEASTQNLTVKVVDNTEFTGDVKLVLNIVNVTGVNAGMHTTCTVTIVDDEHPLQSILGTYKNSFLSNYDGPSESVLTLTKDEKDVHTVWINPIVAAVNGRAVYGIVNDDMTEIAIPINQAIGSNSTYDVVFEGFDAEGESLPTGSHVIAKIKEDGSIVIDEYIYTASAYNLGTDVLAGYLDIVLSSIWTKQ